MSSGAGHVETRRIRVSGLVQGVGFRPTVWRFAHEEGLTGYVLNDGGGVAIEATGPPSAVERFCRRLSAEAPPLARIDGIETTVVSEPGEPATAFVIRDSAAGVVATGIVPDAATCPDCLAECLDQSDRRHGYAFTNCTHCGPRLSIVQAIPYDRRTTTMAPFGMCPACRHEYDSPADRRFHAQPNACPACGPRLWLEDESGPRSEADPLQAAARLICVGGIVAVKGIGGFHLACDATSEAAVAELRRRKARDDKPLAVMARDLDMARTLARVGAAEAAALSSPAAPIVLLERRADAPLAPAVAPRHRRIGVMLPYTPLHHLLLSSAMRPLVMTSGNRSDEPQCTTNDGARVRLAGIADAWLMHDREIANRLDDSVVRIDTHGPAVLRRARGYAPAPLALAPGFASAPVTLAFGGELKATFCILSGASATLSQHLGDLEEPATCADFRNTLALYRRLFEVTPAIVAIDKHPDYASNGWGAALARETGARLVTVQHHHAHLAAVLAEHGIGPEATRALGIILDGTGLGDDGTIWGGEFLLGGYLAFDRVAHLEPIRLPGGAAAIREPWRNTLAHVRASSLAGRFEAGLDHAALDWLRQKPVAVMDAMLKQGLNAPLASSAGRLFDAVAGALGICRDRQAYEGQAAMELEAMAMPYASDATPYPVSIGDTPSGAVSFAPMWPALLDDLAGGVPRGVVAARFHGTLIAAIARTVARLAGRHHIDVVALSGGVFQNRILLEGSRIAIGRIGLPVLTHCRVPSNDGGLSLGQAAIAAAIATAAP